MNKIFMKKLLAMLMMLVMLAGMAVAEETEEIELIPGNIPQRGLVFPMTDADKSEMFLVTGYMVGATADISEVPVAYITFMDEEGAARTMSKYSEEDLQNTEDMDLLWEILIEMLAHNHTLYTIVLYEKDYYDAQIAAGKTAADVIGMEEADVLGENDGYVYVGANAYAETMEMMTTDTQKAQLEKSIARCKELIQNVSFQPIVFDEGEFTAIPEGELAFTTQDLAGNTVTNDIFLGKKLTVLNVWGTFCNPCIEEMPELAEWSKNMPEGVQLVGLVSDLNSYENAEILETARYICEATGADAYTSLIAGEDFSTLLSGVVGVPTTFFIDGNGNFVGDPIVGANVPACKAFVESYAAE